MTTLDWRRHRTGAAKRCVICGQPAFMRDEGGAPSRKVCAERELDGSRR